MAIFSFFLGHETNPENSFKYVVYGRYQNHENKELLLF